MFFFAMHEVLQFINSKSLQEWSYESETQLIFSDTY